MNEENKKKLDEQLIRCVLDDKLEIDKKLRKMDYIIKMGGDIDAECGLGYSVLSLAKMMQNDEVIKFLEERGAEDSGFDIEKAEEFFKSDSVEEINRTLKVLPDGYELDCDVDLSERGLTELPDFSKVVVNGNFNCSDNQLMTLNGAPSKVRGSFYCFCNYLTTLKGAPSEVGASFNCSYNRLISLVGIPKEIGNNFICRNNIGLSIDAKPDKICGKFRAPDIKLGRKIYNILTRGGDRNER